MAQVDINIHGRIYKLSCADSEVDNIKRVGLELNRMAIEITSSTGQIQESMLLLMLAVLAKDEALLAKDREDKTNASIIPLLEKITRLVNKIEKG